MKKIYYEKKGRRYVPVAEHDNEYLDSFPKGNHLVMCYPGGSSRRFNIDPNYAAMIAAGRVAEDAMSRAIWRKLAKEFGDELATLNIASARDIAEAGVKAQMAEADKLMQHASVRRAYEQFLLICKLTLTSNKVE
jgi:inorganic pyrophosphatase/exopolyphosphatase